MPEAELTAEIAEYAEIQHSDFSGSLCALSERQRSALLGERAREEAVSLKAAKIAKIEQPRLEVLPVVCRKQN